MIYRSRLFKSKPYYCLSFALSTKTIFYLSFCHISIYHIISIYSFLQTEVLLSRLISTANTVSAKSIGHATGPHQWGNALVKMGAPSAPQKPLTATELHLKTQPNLSQAPATKTKKTGECWHFPLEFGHLRPSSATIPSNGTQTISTASHPREQTLMRTIWSLGAHPLHHQHPIQDVVAHTNGKDGHDPIPPDTDGGGLRLHQYGKEMRTLIQVLRRYLILLRTLSTRTQTRSPKQNGAVGPSCHLALVMAKTLAKSCARKLLSIDILI